MDSFQCGGKVEGTYQRLLPVAKLTFGCLYRTSFQPVQSGNIENSLLFERTLWVELAAKGPSYGRKLVTA